MESKSKLEDAVTTLIAASFVVAIHALFILGAWNLVLVDAIGIRPISWWGALLLTAALRMTIGQKVEES